MAPGHVGALRDILGSRTNNVKDDTPRLVPGPWGAGSELRVWMPPETLPLLQQ